MSNCTALRFTALGVLALGLASLVACSSTDRDNSGGTIRRKDAGGTTETPDAGSQVVLDSGTTTTCNNPACVANQLMGPAPDCMCLAACSGGLTYNPGTNHCDSQTTNPDAGTTTFPDAGTTTNPDAGSAGTACTTASQCPGPNAACVTVDQTAGAIVTCTGQADCECAVACAFDSPAVGCASGQRCSFAGSSSTVPGRGVCAASTGGVAAGQTCQATFNGQDFTGDNCEIGSFCFGADASNPIGTCGQLCDPSNQAPCRTFGSTYHCYNFDDPTSTIGFCRNQLSATDIGRSCTAAGSCQAGVCSPELGDSCSADCTNGIIDECPSGSTCVGLQAGGAICAKDCTAGADTGCSSLNTNTVCETLGTAPDTFSICIPRCTMDAECSPGTCSNGHCM